MKQVTLITTNNEFIGRIYEGKGVKVPSHLKAIGAESAVSLNGVSIRAVNYNGMVLAYPTPDFLTQVRNSSSIAGKHLCYPFELASDNLELPHNFERPHLKKIEEGWQQQFNIPHTPIQVPVYFKNPFNNMEETVCGRAVLDSETHAIITKNWDKRLSLKYVDPYANKFIENVTTDFLEARFLLHKFTEFAPYVRRMDLISKTYQYSFLSYGLSLIQTSPITIRARYVLYLGNNVLETPDLPEYNNPVNNAQLTLLHNMASSQMDRIFSHVVEKGNKPELYDLFERYGSSEVEVVGYNQISDDYLTLIGATNEDYR